MSRRKSARAFTLTAFLACAVSTLPLGAQEWTRFRGPNGTGIGHAATLPVQITSRDYLWRTRLPGEGHSSPVLWGERLFITSADDAKGKGYLLCLHARTGAKVWRRTFDFKAYHKHQFNASASSTPVVDGRRVYVVWPSPESVLVAASDHNGKEAWRKDLGPLQTQHGGASSPILAGDVLILGVLQESPGTASFVYGLDRATGAMRWQIPRKVSGSSAYSSPAVYAPPQGKPEIVFSSTAHGLTSIDAETGSVNWELPGLFTLRCVASPVVAGNLIFATAGEGAGTRQAVAVRPGSARNRLEPKVEYRIARGPCYVPTPIATGGRIFGWGDGGIVTCLKADTGEQVWSERVGGNFFGSPVFAAGRLYAVSARGELVVIEAADRFELLGRSDLGEPSHATPAIANGRMFIRTVSHLVCIGK